MYEWKATIALLLIGAGSFGSALAAFRMLSLNISWSMIIGVVVGLGIGIGYNILAESMGWQKLHWLDIALWDSPADLP